mmetsp:Transcript_108946/g.314638  ORF Transcript_108946/g.314638 Transcript_108946/m.314638 type:complete len:209 (+) Transcript_108946:3268-3894(+)
MLDRGFPRLRNKTRRALSVGLPRAFRLAYLGLREQWPRGPHQCQGLFLVPRWPDEGVLHDVLDRREVVQQWVRGRCGAEGLGRLRSGVELERADQCEGRMAHLRALGPGASAGHVGFEHDHDVGDCVIARVPRHARVHAERNVVLLGGGRDHIRHLRFGLLHRRDHGLAHRPDRGDRIDRLHRLCRDLLVARGPQVRRPRCVAQGWLR